MEKKSIFVYCDNNMQKLSDRSFKFLTVPSSQCLLISKILSLVMGLGFNKKAFEMSSFQSFFQELGNYI